MSQPKAKVIYVRPDQIKQNEVAFHQSLPPKFKCDADNVFHYVKHCDLTECDQAAWTDGFRFDISYENEILIWQVLALSTSFFFSNQTAEKKEKGDIKIPIQVPGVDSLSSSEVREAFSAIPKDLAKEVMADMFRITSGGKIESLPEKKNNVNYRQKIIDCLKLAHAASESERAFALQQKQKRYSAMFKS